VTSARGRVPLDRALSKLGLATRTEARTLIAEGRVAVDGRIAREATRLVVPERIAITIDGASAAPPPPVTIVLHKPRGVVTTRRDPDGRRTVYDLLDDLDAHVIPVGRLDYATSGLLLLTNDTRLADWLTDPAHEVPRIYLVTVRGRVTPEDVAALERGLTIAGERLAARAVSIRKASGRESLLVVELVEGRNRELRRMLSALGRAVIRLRRVQFGGITLAGLAPGMWRRLSHEEITCAFPAHASSLHRARKRG